MLACWYYTGLKEVKVLSECVFKRMMNISTKAEPFLTAFLMYVLRVWQSTPNQLDSLIVSKTNLAVTYILLIREKRRIFSPLL